MSMMSARAALVVTALLQRFPFPAVRLRLVLEVATALAAVNNQEEHS
jgi:hypothetical protein